MKETRITVPEGYEVEKIEPIEGAIIVTYKEKERKLPKSWEEFCEMFPIKKGEAYFSTYNLVAQYNSNYDSRAVEEKMTLPDRATAEAVLTLCQLIQLRNCYNGDWVPDWNGSKKIYFIIFDSLQNIRGEFYSETPRSFLYFKTKELRDEFLRNFRQLIDKLKPLYGIKKGGEE